MNIFESIYESQLILESVGRYLYHGSANQSKGEAILKAGILKGRDTQGPERLAPVARRVYLTDDIEYAMIYALGGVVAGTSLKSPLGEGRYGFLFLIDKNRARNPQPDEDSIGELIYKKEARWLMDLARNVLTTELYLEVMDGEYDAWAKAGKIILGYLDRREKADIIKRYDVHISVDDPVRIEQSWRIDKELQRHLKKDGSNFFDIAERVTHQGHLGLYRGMAA